MKSAPIKPGYRIIVEWIGSHSSVLDLGCGDGNTALPAARLGANVFGVDIASNLVEAGKKRAKQQGVENCTFQEREC